MFNLRLTKHLSTLNYVELEALYKACLRYEGTFNLSASLNILMRDFNATATEVCYNVYRYYVADLKAVLAVS